MPDFSTDAIIAEVRLNIAKAQSQIIQLQSQAKRVGDSLSTQFNRAFTFSDIRLKLNEQSLKTELKKVTNVKLQMKADLTVTNQSITEVKKQVKDKLSKTSPVKIPITFDATRGIKELNEAAKRIGPLLINIKFDSRKIETSLKGIIQGAVNNVLSQIRGKVTASGGGGPPPRSGSIGFQRTQVQSSNPPQRNPIGFTATGGLDVFAAGRKQSGSGGNIPQPPSFIEANVQNEVKKRVRKTVKKTVDAEILSLDKARSLNLDQISDILSGDISAYSKEVLTFLKRRKTGLATAQRQKLEKVTRRYTMSGNPIGGTSRFDPPYPDIPITATQLLSSPQRGPIPVRGSSRLDLAAMHDASRQKMASVLSQFYIKKLEQEKQTLKDNLETNLLVPIGQRRSLPTSPNIIGGGFGRKPPSPPSPPMSPPPDDDSDDKKKMRQERINKKLTLKKIAEFRNRDLYASSPIKNMSDVISNESSSLELQKINQQIQFYRDAVKNSKGKKLFDIKAPGEKDSLFNVKSIDQIITHITSLENQRNSILKDTKYIYKDLLKDGQSIVGEYYQGIEATQKEKKEVQQLLALRKQLFSTQRDKNGRFSPETYRAGAQLEKEINRRKDNINSIQGNQQLSREQIKQFIATSALSGNFNLVNRDAISYASRGVGFDVIKKNEEERLKKEIERREFENIREQRRLRGGFFDDKEKTKNPIQLEEEDRAKARSRSEQQIGSKGFARELGERLKLAIIQLIKELKTVSTPLGNVNFKHGDIGLGLQRTREGDQIVDDTSVKRIENLKQQWESAQAAEDSARQRSLNTNKIQEAHIKIIDRVVDAHGKVRNVVAVNEKVYYKYGQQIGNVINLQEKGAAFTARLGNDFATAAHKVAQWALATGAVYGTLRTIRNIVSTIKEVDLAVSQSRQVLNPLTTDFDRLKKTAGDLAVEFGGSFSETTKIITDFAKQGFNLEQSIVAAGKALMFANISNISNGESVKLLTAVMKQLNVEANRLGPVIDSLSAVADSTAVDVGDLAKGIARSGNAAKTVGVDFDHLVGIIATVGEATQRSGREVGNAYRTIFARSVSKESIKLFQELGLEVVNAKGEIKSFTGTIEDLSKIWNTLSDFKKINIAEALGGKTRFNEVLTLLDNYDRYTQAVSVSQNSLGESQYKNAQIMNSYAKTIDVAAANFQKLAVSIGDSGLLDILKFVTNQIGDVAEKLNGLNSTVRSFIVGAAALPALFGVGSFIATTTGILGRNGRQSTTSSQSFESFLSGMREVTQEQTNSLVAALNKNTAEMIAAQQGTTVAETAGDVAIATGGSRGKIGQWWDKLLGKVKDATTKTDSALMNRKYGVPTFYSPIKKAASAVGSGASQFGEFAMGLPILGNLLKGFKSGLVAIVASVWEVVPVLIGLAALGGVIFAAIEIFKKLTKSTDEYLNDENNRIDLLRKERQAMIDVIRQSDSFKYNTNTGKIEKGFNKAPTRNEINSILLNTANSSNSSLGFSSSIDQDGKLKYTIGFMGQLTNNTLNAEEAIKRLNEQLSLISSQKVSTELDGIDSSMRDIGVLGTTLFRGRTVNSNVQNVGNVQLTSKSVRSFLESIQTNDPKKIAENVSALNKEIESILNTVQSATKDKNILEIFGDPAKSSQLTKVFEILGERTAAVSGNLKVLSTEQDKVKFGFQQYIGSVLQSQNPLIKATNGIFDSETFDNYLNKLVEVTNKHDKNGNTIVRAAKEVVIWNGRLKESEDGYLDSNIATVDQLQKYLKPEMVAISRVTNGYSRDLFILTRDTDNQIVALDEYGKKVPITTDLLKNLVVVTNELSKTFEAQSLSIKLIIDSLTELQTKLSEIRKSSENIGFSSEIKKQYTDFRQSITGQSSSSVTGDLVRDLIGGQKLNALNIIGKSPAGSGNLRGGSEVFGTLLRDLATTGISGNVNDLLGAIVGKKSGPAIADLVSKSISSLNSSQLIIGTQEGQLKGSGKQGALALEAIQKQQRLQAATLFASILQSSGKSDIRFGENTSSALSRLGLDNRRDDVNKIGKSLGLENNGIFKLNINDLFKDVPEEDLQALTNPEKFVEKMRENLKKADEGVSQAKSDLQKSLSDLYSSVKDTFDKLNELGEEKLDIFGKNNKIGGNLSQIRDGIVNLVDVATRFGDIDMARSIRDAADETLKLNRELRGIAESVNDIKIGAGTSGGSNTVSGLMNIINALDKAQLELSREKDKISSATDISQQEKSSRITDILSKQGANRALQQKDIEKIFSEESKTLSGTPLGKQSIETVRGLIPQIQGAKSVEDVYSILNRFSQRSDDLAQSARGTQSFRVLNDNLAVFSQAIRENSEKVLGQASKEAITAIEQMRVKVLNVDAMNITGGYIKNAEQMQKLGITSDLSDPENIKKIFQLYKKDPNLVIDSFSRGGAASKESLEKSMKIVQTILDNAAKSGPNSKNIEALLPTAFGNILGSSGASGAIQNIFSELIKNIANTQGITQGFSKKTEFEGQAKLYTDQISSYSKYIDLMNSDKSTFRERDNAYLAYKNAASSARSAFGTTPNMTSQFGDVDVVDKKIKERLSGYSNINSETTPFYLMNETLKTFTSDVEASLSKVRENIPETFLNKDTMSQLVSSLNTLKSFQIDPKNPSIPTSDKDRVSFLDNVQKLMEKVSTNFDSLVNPYKGGKDTINQADAVTQKLNELANQYSQTLDGSFEPLKKAIDDLTNFINLRTSGSNVVTANSSAITTTTTTTTLIPKQHKGSLNLGKPDEFLAILQSGEAVVPRNLVPLIPREITSRLPKFHTGGLFGDTSFVNNDTLYPQEISNTLVQLLNVVKSISTSILTSKTNTSSTDRLQESLNIQSEYLLQLVSEIKNLNNKTSQTNNIDVIASAIQDSISVGLEQISRSLVGRDSSSQQANSIDNVNVLITPTQGMEIKHEISLTDIPQDMLLNAIVQLIKQNPSLILNTLTSVPV